MGIGKRVSVKSGVWEPHSLVIVCVWRWGWCVCWCFVGVLFLLFLFLSLLVVVVVILLLLLLGFVCVALGCVDVRTSEHSSPRKFKSCIFLSMCISLQHFSALNILQVLRQNNLYQH